MQIDLQKNEQIIDVLKSAGNVAVIPCMGSGIDGFCAGVALHLMLKDLGKDSKILYPEGIEESCKDLISESDILNSFSTRQLTVSIDYSNQNNTKAWYEPQGNTLNVKLDPVDKDFDINARIKTHLGIGFEFDKAIIVGANDFDDLGYIYNEIQKELSDATLINLSNSGRNTRFGSINIVDPTSDSLSQLVIKKASLWGLNITTKAAQALLMGITQK